MKTFQEFLAEAKKPNSEERKFQQKVSAANKRAKLRAKKRKPVWNGSR